jgi:SAM-dependent methyltransferase
VRSIYDEPYASAYPELYLSPWPDKHRGNIEVLGGLLDGLAAPGRRPQWLDLACGQAWHFWALRGRAEMVGVDLSDAQLARARARSPEATFVCADMAAIEFPPAGFDLVTNFWAGYCYLRSQARIAALLERAVRWLAPGGALYIEVLTGEALASFNASGYASRTGFAVTSLSADGCDWEYEDAGGRHLMTSPPLERFLEIVEPKFGAVEVRHSGGFMTDLVCRERLDR